MHFPATSWRKLSSIPPAANMRAGSTEEKKPPDQGDHLRALTYRKRYKTACFAPERCDNA